MIVFLRDLAPASPRACFGAVLEAALMCLGLLLAPVATAQTACDNGVNDCSCPVYVAFDPGNIGDYGMWSGSFDSTCFIESTGNMNP